MIINSTELKKAFKEVSLLTDGSTRPILGGVNVKIDGCNLVLTALDGYKMTQRKLNLSLNPGEKAEKHDFTIIAPALTAVKSGYTEIEVNEKSVIFKTIDGSQEVKKLDGDYLNVDNLFDEYAKKTFRVCLDRKYLIEMLKSMEGNKVIIEASNKPYSPIEFYSDTQLSRAILLPVRMAREDKQELRGVL